MSTTEGRFNTQFALAATERVNKLAVAGRKDTFVNSAVVDGDSMCGLGSTQ